MRKTEGTVETQAASSVESPEAVRPRPAKAPRWTEPAGHRWSEPGEFAPADPRERKRWSPDERWLLPPEADVPYGIRLIGARKRDSDRIVSFEHERFPTAEDDEGWKVPAGRKLKAIHRAFAELASGSDETRLNRMAGFADRYGLLDPGNAVDVVRMATPWDSMPFTAEPLSLWQGEADSVALIAAVWRLASNADAPGLRRYVGSLDVDRPVRGRRPSLASRRDWEDAAAMAAADADTVAFIIDTGDLFTALAWLRQSGALDPRSGLRDEELVDRVREAVFVAVESRVAGRLDVRIARRPPHRVEHVARSLLGAVHLSLMEEMCEAPAVAMATCAFSRCGKQFVRSHGKQRYCSPQCTRLASYYGETKRPSTASHSEKDETVVAVRDEGK